MGKIGIKMEGEEVSKEIKIMYEKVGKALEECEKGKKGKCRKIECSGMKSAGRKKGR